MAKKKINKRALAKAGAIYKRPRGRAPKGKKWDYSSGQWVHDYDAYAKLVRRANDRLRELERSGENESSSMYKIIEGSINSKPWTEGRPFKETAGKIRFRGKRDFEKMSEKEQDYYLKRLESFLKSKTTTRTGQKGIFKKISEANKGRLDITQKSYEEFMKNEMVKERYPNLTFEEYQRLFEEFEKLKANKADHYGSDDINQLFEYVDVKKIMTDPEGRGVEDLITALHLLHVGDFEKVIDRGWAALEYY